MKSIRSCYSSIQTARASLIQRIIEMEEEQRKLLQQQTLFTDTDVSTYTIEQLHAFLLSRGYAESSISPSIASSVGSSEPQKELVFVDQHLVTTPVFEVFTDPTRLAGWSSVEQKMPHGLETRYRAALVVKAAPLLRPPTKGRKKVY
ncbi:MAG: hypothetical protein JSS82_00115 [Bacteroidetes bacterium]|nr:hypothetical protein [Bacteroidota bacterium]